MALSVLDTEAGRAMLLNAAMRQADMGRQLYTTELFEMMQERWPHWVHYRGNGSPVYCPPDTFGFMGVDGPSHCDWMIPGSHEW